MALRLIVLLAIVLALSEFAVDAAIVKHTFNVENHRLRRLCKKVVNPAVNGQVPGPTIYASEGDTILINVTNRTPYNLTIHWHGVFQYLTPWADGAVWLTQCPIRPGTSYLYQFNVTGQEGTMFWHAHTGLIRATVHGAIIILPKQRPPAVAAAAYPFPQPYKEVPILLGEWWNTNLAELENTYVNAGSVPPRSDALTINGQPGHLYPCSDKHIFKMEVEYGKTYLLRIVNTAPVIAFFFKVAGHSFTVVALEGGSYTTPYTTDLLVVAAGQSVDALMVADAAPGHYYMTARPYLSLPESIPLSYTQVTPTTAVVKYKPAAPASSSSRPPAAVAMPAMPTMPSLYDTPTANKFYTNLTSLVRPGASSVPLNVDEKMFVTFSMGYAPCLPSETQCNKTTGAVAASMNNASFQLPTPMPMSMLEAMYYGLRDGIYTTDFPDEPPVKFDYTNNENNRNMALMPTARVAKVRKLKYNATVEIVLQNAVLIGPENHPFHLHGYEFFILAQGFGNYDAKRDIEKYNLVNPQKRNTVAVPRAGWAVIRFVANNPGIWYMHCHVDFHMQLGMGMAFEVESGPTPETIIPPPPRDFPMC